MTTQQPPLFSSSSGEYRQQLERALDEHLTIVRDHAAGVAEAAPWDFDAALVAVRWIAQELRSVSLSEDGDIPF